MKAGETMSRSVEQIISEIFGVDEGSISDQDTPDNIDQWDSMNHLKLVTAIEDEYKIKLSMKEIQSMLSVDEIKSIIAERS